MAKHRHKAGKKISTKGLESVDLWILSRLNSLSAKVTESLEKYDACTAASAIESFIIEDFSRFYLKFAKRRFDDGRMMKKTVDVIDYVLLQTLILSSPLMPFVSEGIYIERYRQNPSIFFEKWPKRVAK